MSLVRRLGWRWLLVVLVASFLALVGGAYGILVLVTPSAPSPPRFGQDTTPSFAPELDGRWYGPNCRWLRIVGGWVQPGFLLIAAPNGTELSSNEPIDLTGLRMDGRVRDFYLPSLHLSIRWRRSLLLIEGSASEGRRVALRLVRRPQGC